MSKANMLIMKKSPTVSILNKPKNLIQNHVTYRQGLKEQDSQKLYTFCSSEQKQIKQTQQESNDAKDRKASFNNSKNKVYRPLSKSKGKTVSQVNINKDRRKQTNNSTIISSNILSLNNSNFIQRKKIDKIVGKDNKKQEKMINISINLNRNYINEIYSKQNKKQVLNNQHSNTKPFKQKTVCMSEQQLSRFTKKQAVDKVQLQQTIRKLQQQLKELEQKQIEWSNYKKDSQDYIRYLLKEKQGIIMHYQSLQKQVNLLQSDKEYYLIAKQQYQNTIKQQQEYIQELSKQVVQSKRLGQQVHILQAKIKQLESGHNEASAALMLLQNENSHLKKELQINQKHQNIKDSYLLQNEELRKRLQDLNTTKEILLTQIKQIHVFKLKCEVFQRTLEQSNNTIAKLKQQNDNLKQIVRKQRSAQQKSQGNNSEFQFRLDTSPHSLNEVEVIQKRQQSRKNIGQSNIRQYFDHDFFSGFTKQKL